MVSLFFHDLFKELLTLPLHHEDFLTTVHILNLHILVYLTIHLLVSHVVVDDIWVSVMFLLLIFRNDIVADVTNIEIVRGLGMLVEIMR